MSEIKVATASLRDWVVCAIQLDDRRHMAYQVEIAEFENKEDAQALVAALNALIKLSKPKKSLGEFGRVKMHLIEDSNANII